MFEFKFHSKQAWMPAFAGMTRLRFCAEVLGAGFKPAPTRLPQLFFLYWRDFVGLFPLFEHPMPEHGVGIGENRRRLHRSIAVQPKAMNGSGRNHDARLTFNFVLLLTDANETFALHLEENQDFLSIVPVKGARF